MSVELDVYISKEHESEKHTDLIPLRDRIVKLKSAQ